MSTRRSFMRALTNLVGYDKDMPLTRVQVLLVIALNDGCLVRDIVDRTGLNQSTIARTLALLGDKPVRGQKEGFRWVTQRADHEDPRRSRCYLTPTGKAVMAQVDDLLT